MSRLWNREVLFRVRRRYCNGKEMGEDDVIHGWDRIQSGDGRY